MPNITDLATLLHYLKLPQKKYLKQEIQTVIQQFPLRVPKEFLQKMRSADAHDPLLRQVLPTLDELKKVAGFSNDPLEESSANLVPGLLHKYKGRTLLLVTQKCAIHCRFCFRRHFAEPNHDFVQDYLPKIITYIKNDKTIREVILSGGDPLILPDRKIDIIIQKLAAIAHIKRLRIHTRVPVVSPARVTEKLINLLTATRLQPIVVIHCNHPAEIDAAMISAIKILRTAQINVFNQSVLLRGVNDNSATLIKLSEDLGDIGVIPYYLHLLDHVAGAAHFAVPLKKAKKIYPEMQVNLPGFLVPKLVCEKAGESKKLSVVC